MHLKLNREILRFSIATAVVAVTDLGGCVLLRMIMQHRQGDFVHGRESHPIPAEQVLDVR